VVAKHNPLLYLMPLSKFVIEVEGAEYAGPWGERTVAVTTGEHTVRMWFRYLGRKCGLAEVSITATSDATTSISYQAPLVRFSPGKASVQQ